MPPEKPNDKTFHEIYITSAPFSTVFPILQENQNNPKKSDLITLFYCHPLIPRKFIKENPN